MHVLCAVYDAARAVAQPSRRQRLSARERRRVLHESAALLQVHFRPNYLRSAHARGQDRVPDGRSRLLRSGTTYQRLRVPVT